MPSTDPPRLDAAAIAELKAAIERHDAAEADPGGRVGGVDCPANVAWLAVTEQLFAHRHALLAAAEREAAGVVGRIEGSHWRKSPGLPHVWTYSLDVASQRLPDGPCLIIPLPDTPDAEARDDG